MNKIGQENVYNTMTVLYEALENKYCLIGKFDIDDMYTLNQMKEISGRISCNPIYYGCYFSIAALLSNGEKVSNNWFDQLSDFIKNETNSFEKNCNKNKNKNKIKRSARDKNTLVGYDIACNNFSGFRASIIRNDVWNLR